jgi:mRNA interferase RelE/StbE
MEAIAYSKSVIRTLRRQSVNEALRIREKVGQNAIDPAAPGNNIKTLQGREGYRLRVGDWRMIFDEDGTVLSILDISPRRSIFD